MTGVISSNLTISDRLAAFRIRQNAREAATNRYLTQSVAQPPVEPDIIYPSRATALAARAQDENFNPTPTFEAAQQAIRRERFLERDQPPSRRLSDLNIISQNIFGSFALRSAFTLTTQSPQFFNNRASSSTSNAANVFSYAQIQNLQTQSRGRNLSISI
ncbi:MAG: hypothetical protein AAF403_06280 [Pseudomonadota bacterium]